MRPTKYREEYNEQAYKLTLLGLIDIELADYFEVEEKTINNWKIAHPTFLQSIRSGKTIADAEVAYELRIRALKDDTRAAMFWLKNRQPTKWRDKQDIDIKNVTQTRRQLEEELAGMSDEEQRLYLAQLLELSGQFKRVE